MGDDDDDDDGRPQERPAEEHLGVTYIHTYIHEDFDTTTGERRKQEKAMHPCCVLYLP